MVFTFSKPFSYLVVLFYKLVFLNREMSNWLGEKPFISPSSKFQRCLNTIKNFPLFASLLCPLHCKKQNKTIFIIRHLLSMAFPPPHPTRPFKEDLWNKVSNGGHCPFGRS